MLERSFNGSFLLAAGALADDQPDSEHCLPDAAGR